MHGTHFRALVVSHRQSIQEMLKMLIEGACVEEGVQLQPVEGVITCTEALALIEKGPVYDLIVSDFNYGAGYDARTLIRETRAQWPGTRFIIGGDGPFNYRLINALSAELGIEIGWTETPYRPGEFGKMVQRIISEAPALN